MCSFIGVKVSKWNHLISGYHLWGIIVAGGLAGGGLEDIQGVLSAGDGGYDRLEPILINKGTRQRAYIIFK
jgi:hypothetical protein